MKPSHRLVLIASLACLTAASAAAEEPQPATASAVPAVSPLAADPVAGLADVPENQEERAAILSGELILVVPDGATSAPGVDAAGAERRAAFDAVQNEQDVKVQALADKLAAADGDEARLALQMQIEKEKAATGRRLLELQLEFAKRDADQARVDQLEAALTAWDAPAPTSVPVERPIPALDGR